MKDINERFEKLMKEDELRIYTKIIERIDEAGLPKNWWSGRQTNVHGNQSKEMERDRDKTNFEKQKDVSGQPDLEEHHEDYPDEVLTVPVGSFLTKLKEKDVDMYHAFENIIDKYLGKDGVDEMATFRVDDLVPDAIPQSHRKDNDMKKDLVTALNKIFEKYKVNIRVK